VLRRNKAETLKGFRPTKEIWVTVPLAPIQVKSLSTKLCGKIVFLLILEVFVLFEIVNEGT
jgi:hypothetical protein